MKKPEKWKKHSVSIFVHFYPRKNVSTSDLSSSKITSVGKRNLGNISQPRRCLGLEKFFLGSFFLLRQKLGKTQIRRGQILPGIKLDKYRNKILIFMCSNLSIIFLHASLGNKFDKNYLHCLLSHNIFSLQESKTILFLTEVTQFSVKTGSEQGS